MPPAAIQQVPLDRVTQTIYARIHAAMTPMRMQRARLHDSAALLADTVGKFRDTLPALDLSSYNTMRDQLAQLVNTLHGAIHVPLSAATRSLGAQLIDHDLPRLAAIAVKLNEDDAPKFFAAIKKPDSPFETFAAEATQKTTLRKSDVDAAIQQIVEVRLDEFIRRVKEDTAKWLSNPHSDATQHKGRTPLRSRVHRKVAKPIVTFSDGFKTVNCARWPQSESRQRKREATTILQRLYENWRDKNQHLPTSTVLKGGSAERIEKALDKHRYPRAFSLLDIRLDNKTGAKTIRLSDEYDYESI